MHAHHTAKGIASLGRHGDDMIVHMSRDEVKGLQALAQQHGTSLTINPHTGMPEAFKLGNVFKAILPMAAGFALGPGGFGLLPETGLFSGALGAGLLVGGATGLMTGNLGQGLMAGLGAYGGFDLSKAWQGMGGTDAFKNANIFSQAQAAPNTMAEQALRGTAQSNLAGGVGNIGPNMGLVNTGSNIFSPSAIATPANYIPGGPYMPSATEVIKPVAPDYSTIAKNVPTQTATPVVSKTIAPNSGIKGVWEAYKANEGTPFKLATTIGSPILAGVEPSDLEPDAVDWSKYQPQKRIQTGTDSQGKPIYSYMAESAYSPYETLNLNDPLANYPGRTAAPQLKLVAEGGEIKSYAIGGAIDNNASSSAGISDLYNRPEGQTMENLSQDGYGIGRLNNLANAEAMNTARVTGYANGGIIALASGGETMADVVKKAVGTSNYRDDQAALNLDQIKALNVGALSNPDYYSPAEVRDQFARAPGFLPKLIYLGWDSMKNSEGLSIGEQLAKNPLPRSSGVQYAKGGYLDGPGDGMSDSIPATIEGKQPARLADGEFVIPADVVSHLGNGSTKAGSKRLYAMLDKVRQARTGTKKQGRQINPNKFLPA